MVFVWNDLQEISDRVRESVEHSTRNVDVKLPGKGNSNSHSARPVHLIIKMIKWIRTSRLSIKDSLCRARMGRGRSGSAPSAPRVQGLF